MRFATIGIARQLPARMIVLLCVVEAGALKHPKETDFYK